jgi:hypothetical protein
MRRSITKATAFLDEFNVSTGKQSVYGIRKAYYEYSVNYMMTKTLLHSVNLRKNHPIISYGSAKT